MYEKFEYNKVTKSNFEKFFAVFFSSAFGNRFFGDFFPFLKAPNLDFCAHSQCFRAFSQNRRFRKSTEKKLDFGVVFGGQSDKKS